MSETTTATIPQLEPELVRAIARDRHQGDDTKVATTSLPQIVAHGVVVTSRFRKAYELTKMVRMLDGIEPALRSNIAALDCDSKVGSQYSASLKAGSAEYAAAIGHALGRAAQSRAAGHNGIFVDDHEGAHLSSVDPEWPDDDE